MTNPAAPWLIELVGVEWARFAIGFMAGWMVCAVVVAIFWFRFLMAQKNPPPPQYVNVGPTLRMNLRKVK